MLIQFRDELIKTPILDESVRDLLVQKEQENGHYLFWTDSPDFFLTALEGKIMFSELELAEPVSVFKKLGCYVGDTRRVQVLHRTRFLSDAKRGVFAYPIAIALDGSQTLLTEE